MEVSCMRDLDVEVTFKNEEGQIVDVPEYDFEIDFYVHAGRKVTARRSRGVLINCEIIDKDGNEALAIHFDMPRLGRGALMQRKYLHVPDDRFPDGVYDLIGEEEYTGHILL